MEEYTERIIDQIKHYLQDDTYPYAVMLNGAWGTGKTWFVKNQLIPADDSCNTRTAFLQLPDKIPVSELPG